jgi:hypothetical protein
MSSSTPTPSERLHPLLELTKARLREFFREPGMIFWVFGFPIVMAVGLGLAFRSQPPEKPAVAVLGPDSPASEAAASVRALLGSAVLAAVGVSEEDALRGLARTRYALVVDLRGGEPVYRYDPVSSSARLARALADAELQRAAGRKDVLSPRDEPQTLAGTRYIDFLLPGLIGLNIMGSSVWGVGYSLVVARKRKLLRRFAVTAMRRSDYLLSYFLSRLVFLGLELGVLVAFGAGRVRGARVRHGHSGQHRGLAAGLADRSSGVRRPGPAHRGTRRQHGGGHGLDELHPAADVGALGRLLHQRALSRVDAALHPGLATHRPRRRATPHLQRGRHARPNLARARDLARLGTFRLHHFGPHISLAMTASD